MDITLDNQHTLLNKMKKVKTTCALILNHNNEVLLIKRGRDPYKGYWALVSGIFESQKGLPPDEAIKKEIKWDLGTQSFVGSRIFSIPILDDETSDEVIVYAGSINELEIQLKPGFSEEMKWSSLEQSAEEHLAFEHALIIKKYLSIYY